MSFAAATVTGYNQSFAPVQKPEINKPGVIIDGPEPVELPDNPWVIVDGPKPVPTLPQIELPTIDMEQTGGIVGRIVEWFKNLGQDLTGIVRGNQPVQAGYDLAQIATASPAAQAGYDLAQIASGNQAAEEEAAQEIVNNCENVIKY